jgi:3-isopropylmalate dehydrogenase
MIKREPTARTNVKPNNRCSVVGAIGDPKYDNNQKQSAGARIVKIEKRIGSFANIRPIKPYSTLLDSSPLKKEIIEGADFIILGIDWRFYFGEKN